MSKVGGSGDGKSTLYCSFCGKSQHEVRKLIAARPYSSAMNALNCMDIIREESKASLVKTQDGVPTPTEILEVLDDYVIGQHMPSACCQWRAQSLQALESCRQKWRCGTSKSNILLVGPTGCGKTLLAANTRPHPGCAVHHGRCHDADRGRLCW